MGWSLFCTTFASFLLSKRHFLFVVNASFVEMENAGGDKDGNLLGFRITFLKTVLEGEAGKTSEVWGEQ